MEITPFSISPRVWCIDFVALHISRVFSLFSGTDGSCFVSSILAHAILPITLARFSNSELGDHAADRPLYAKRVFSS